MQRLLILFSSLICLLCAVSQVSAAPFLAPGQITGHAGPADPPETPPARIMVSLSFFTQKNQSSTGRERFAWIDPSDENQEERHRARKWRNKLEMQGIEVRGGYALSGLTLYGLAGMAQTDIHAHYMDDTRNFYDTTTTFHDEAHVFFGGGLTAAVARWQPDADSDTRIALDADLRYRYHSLNPDDKQKRSYEATFHEAQFAMGLAAIMEKWSPFTGIRITYLSGEMTFSDPGENIRATKTMDAGKDIGYTFGIRYMPLSWLNLTLASRYGDETGYHLECAFVF